MRSYDRHFGALGATAGALTALSIASAGCVITFPDYRLGSGGASSGSTSSTGAVMITPCVSAACDPDALSPGASVAPTCGLFVAPGSTGGSGTQAAPYGDLSTALAKNTSHHPIYVCATAGPLNDAVTISGVAQVYGGFDCATWKRASMKTAWTAASNSVPLRITNSAFMSCDGAFVDGFAITSAAATGADMTTRNGSSSIGAFVSGGFATLVNVDIVAGNGADGVSGPNLPPRAPGAQSDATFNGNMGAACAAGVMSTGAPTASHTCSGMGPTDGGKGGDGGLTGGMMGGQGLPNPTGVSGYGGGGQTASNACSVGGDGNFGNAGLSGHPGDGGTSLGKLDANGFQGAAGLDGGDGEAGQGGGGGGGAVAAGTNCSAGSPGSGGGSGGAGGCGGKGGAGGGAGGASIALASYGANLLLMNVTLRAQLGGKGADGVAGQAGGAGGSPGKGACANGSCGCDGGKGADGGSGAAGGGGKGGSSFGIAFHGDMPPAISTTSIIVSLSQAMGGGGSGNHGDPGDNVKIQAFP